MFCRVAFDGDAAFQPDPLFRIQPSPNLDVIGLRHVKGRAGQPVRKLSVVRQHQQPGSLNVKPSNRDHALPDALEQADYRRPPLGVGERRHISPRLMQQNGDGLLRALQQFSVHLHVVSFRVRFFAEPAGHTAVDRDASFDQHLLGLPA